MAKATKGRDLKTADYHEKVDGGKSDRQHQKRVLGASADKTWDALSDGEKDDAMKAACIALGLVQPDP